MLNAQPAKIAQSYWILGLVQVVHSIEETYTELYSYFGTMSEALHQHFPWIPIFDISADLFAILNYLIIALMLGSVPSAEKGSQWGYYLMWSWAIIELLNGVFHICTWLFLRHYFPGGVTGPILFVLSIIFIQQLRTALTKEATQVAQ
jgi:Protein of unknown function with HXXEE motif